jgi:hypothetical protein
MRRNAGSSIDPGSNLSDGKISRTPLRNPRQIGGRWLQGGRRRTITTAVHAMARATVAHKDTLALAHDGARTRQGRLLRQGYAQEDQPYNHTETIPLHALPPCVGVYTCMGV